ncbi:MAG: ATP-grasp domain-containing protein [Candidatus Bathyarchaeia archaeon]
MHVAVCYNEKPRSGSSTGSSSEGSSEEASEPPPFSLERYAEFDDRSTIEAVKNALARFHEVDLIEADESAYTRFLKARPDIVFNIAEGLRGPYREAFIPSILEFLQIPYTGSGPLTLSICLDKSLTKQMLSYHGVPTPEFRVASSTREVNEVIEGWVFYPCIVKPVHEGSSIGVWNDSVVEDPSQLSSRLKRAISRYRQPAIVERLLPGREFTVGILGNGRQAKALPIIEIRFDSLPEGSKPVYSYEAKWIWDTPIKPLDIFECPAQVDGKLSRNIEGAALAAYKILGCRDWARIDIRLDERDVPNVLEVNPLPGILPDPRDNSCMPKAARAAGMEYNELILTVLEIACRRYGMKPIELSAI